MAAELLTLALDYHRSPLRYRALANPETPLPSGFDILLKDLCLALAPQNIDAVAKTLGVAPTEITDASLFFLRHVLLAPRANQYRVLGLSPNASQETVKQHYSLLVRIFHPDCSNDGDDRNAAFTSRINAAYKVLRTTESRQCYDDQLAAQVVGGTRLAPDMRDLLRTDAPIQADLKFDKIATSVSPRARRIAVWALLPLSAAIIAFLADQSAEKTLMPMNPMRAKASPPPAYLQSSTAQPFQPYDAASPITFAHRELPQGAEVTKSLDSVTAPGSRWIGESQTRARTELTRVLDGLVRYYEVGDLDGFVDLFTADAETNSGSGRERIREGFSELFMITQRRRLSFSDMRWLSTRQKSISGQGRFRTRSRSDDDSDWYDGVGTVHFELIPRNGSYRIRRMIYHLDVDEVR